MARNANCNYCDKRAELDRVYHVLPVGWISVGMGTEQADFCQLSCLIAWALAREQASGRHVMAPSAELPAIEIPQAPPITTPDPDIPF